MGGRAGSEADGFYLESTLPGLALDGSYGAASMCAVDLEIPMKSLITQSDPDKHLEPSRGVAEIIQGYTGGPMCCREDVLTLAPELVPVINTTLRI